MPKKKGSKESSEFKRGYRTGKKYWSTFRSFKKEGNEYIGYTKSGSRQKIGPLSHYRANKGFGGGWYKAMKEAIKARPTKTRVTKGENLLEMTPRQLKSGLNLI